MRIAEFRESSDLRTQTAPERYLSGMLVSVCYVYLSKLNAIEISLSR